MAQCASAVATTLPHKILLGRDRELGALEAALNDLAEGQGSLLLVTGEPGIGKTRLADELGRTAVKRGLPVHWGRAWEAGGAPSYWPFVQVLRAICRGLDEGALRSCTGSFGAELAELVPELRHRLSLSGVPAMTDRFQLFNAVHAFLSHAPRVIVLDDLHAADPSSLLLLHFLVRDLRSTPLLVIGTYREAEARLAPEIADALTHIAREATVLPLRRLDRTEVSDFIAGTTGAEPSPERVEALHRRTEGNPLFLHELLRLVDRPLMQPRGIREVVRARLSLLTPPVRKVLEVGAVLGREFQLDALASLTRTTELVDLNGQLAPAIDAGIVEPVDQHPPSWRFTHVLLREGLYEDLPAEQRSLLHRAAVAELRRSSPEALAAIAHHALRAVPALDVGEAADAALAAAARAMQLHAFEDAADLLSRVLIPLQSVGPGDVRYFEVLLHLGIARIRAGQVIDGRELCLRASDLVRDRDGERFARAVLGSASEYTPNVRNTRLIALLEEALTKLPDGDGTLRARCMAQLAAERQPEPDTRGPVGLALASLAMARRLADPETLRFVLSHIGLALMIYGPPEMRMELDRECLRLALAAGDKLAALRGHLLLQCDHWELGDLKGAIAHFRAYEEMLQFRHHVRWMPSTLNAAIAIPEGRFEEAARYHRDAEAAVLHDESSGTEMIAFPIGFCRAAERYDDLPGIEARVRSRLGAIGYDLWSCIAEMLICHLHARVGDRSRAELQLASARAHPIFAAIEEPSWLALLVDAAHLLGDVALAERLYDALLPRAHRFYTLGPIGSYIEPPYARQLGLLAETMGRFDSAVDHLVHAETRVVRAGMRGHLARVRYELAGALLRRGKPGDRERATALLEESRALAAELGQRDLLPLIADRLGNPVERPVEPSAGFSFQREGDVWAIRFDGKTARLKDSRGLQLLDRLVASPGQELHVLQLVGASDFEDGDAGTVLDPAAVQSYRARLLDLREDLEEAENFSDTGRAARARDEMEALTRELARAVGLGGRSRRVAGAAERARTTVQKRLRGAIRRVEEELPPLGRHLDQTIRTGMFCGYLPDGRRSKK
jgi:hypothetical protein